MVSDETTLAALKRLSDAPGSADAALPDEGSMGPLLHTAAAYEDGCSKNVYRSGSYAASPGSMPCSRKVARSLSSSVFSRSSSPAATTNDNA